MYTLQTRIALHKVRKISSFSLRLIQLNSTSSLFFYSLGIAKLITRINECIICSGCEFSNSDVEYLFVNSLENSLTRAERTVGSFGEDLKTNNLR